MMMDDDLQKLGPNLVQIYATPCTRSATAADASEQMRAFEISSLFGFFSFIRSLFHYFPAFCLCTISSAESRQKFAPNIFCGSAINDKLASYINFQCSHKSSKYIYSAPSYISIEI